MSKETFKEFVSHKPQLADFVASKEMSWQDFYELYDMYGEDESVWKKYDKVRESSTNITDVLKNLDVDSLEEGMGKIEKALNFFGELTKSSKVEDVASTIPNINRPITKFFGD